MTKRYLPPHKRNVASSFNTEKDKFQEPWLSTRDGNQNKNLKTANFPSLNNNNDNVIENKCVDKNIYNYKSVTDILKKKRELRNKKKNNLPPGWIKLSKDGKYEKTETELEIYYKKQIESERIKKFLNREEEYYRNYEQLTGEDIRYYVSESENEEKYENDYESESVSEEENIDEYYDEQDIYLKKYNRN